MPSPIRVDLQSAHMLGGRVLLESVNQWPRVGNGFCSFQFVWYLWIQFRFFLGFLRRYLVYGFQVKCCTIQKRSEKGICTKSVTAFREYYADRPKELTSKLLPYERETKKAVRHFWCCQLCIHSSFVCMQRVFITTHTHTSFLSSTYSIATSSPAGQESF